MVSCELDKPRPDGASSSAGEQLGPLQVPLGIAADSSSSAGQPVQHQPRRVPPRFAPAAPVPPGLVAGRRAEPLMQVLPQPMPAGLISNAAAPPIEPAAVADDSGSIPVPEEVVLMVTTAKWGRPSRALPQDDPRVEELGQDALYDRGEQLLERGRQVIAGALDLLRR